MQTGSLSRLTRLVAALALVWMPASAMAQLDPEAPADGQVAPPADYRTYSAKGTPRAASDKPADLLARERSIFETQLAACEQGDQSACGQVGRSYELGIGTDQSRPVAAVLYTEACNAGDAESCFRLGGLNRIAEDASGKPEAVGNFRRACELGSNEGCVALAKAYESGTGVEENLDTAEALLRDACPAAGGPACRELARFLIDARESDAQTSEAVALYTAECRSLDIEACDALLSLGHSTEGRIALPDRMQTLFYGCEAGDVLHCQLLGNAAYSGENGERDVDYALSAFDRACSLDPLYCETAEDIRALPILADRCDAGDLAACEEVGRIYLEGDAALVDDRGAYAYLSFACENGRTQACRSAASAALRNSADPQSIEAQQALAYYQRGCDAGDLDACDALADALNWGGSVPQDRPRAYQLYATLCEANQVDACEALEQAATLEPDIPLALADARYVPPIDPDDPDDPVAKEIAAIRGQTKDSCTTTVQTFRGKSYSDTICDSTVRVVGGSKLRPGDAPWQALLWRPKEIPAVGRPFYIDERVLCGGSVIRTGWILTAAHCVRDYGASVAGRGYSIRLGVYNPRNENEGTSYPITRVYTHPSYDPSDYAFDIALIRYDATKGVRGPTSYPITRIAFDTVPVETRRITNATSAFIYGWGWTQADRGRTTAELRGAKLQLSTLEACTAVTKFRGRKLNAALCAAGRNNEQACQGDSGGPLVYYNDADKRPRVIGVISAGRKCGQNRTREASRYTRVALVRQWIERTMAGGR